MQLNRLQHANRCTARWRLRHAKSLAAPETSLKKLECEAPAVSAGVTAVQPSVRVLRALAGRVEPAMALLMQVRAAWRH